MRKEYLLICVGLLAAGPLWSQDTNVRMEAQQIVGPERTAEAQGWLADIQRWRSEKLVRMGYKDAEYTRPELQWTQRSFIQPQMMIEDRYFYDPVAGKYTVDRYLDDLENRYGGIDSVLIWPVYPNIGIDDRNQHDMLRSMPGGIAGLRQMVADFHRRGVRVLFPIMPWDQGTRDEGVPLWIAISRSLKEIGADGINGDTVPGVPLAFRNASDEIMHPLALEPELSLASEEALAWNNMTWGQNWIYPFVPSVSKYKWLERRHMVNIVDRWHRDKTNNLQLAFFNGIGYESWENVWGIWNQITPRDSEALRRVATIERALADLLVSPDWEPHTPTLQYGCFASRFPSEVQTAWTLVNRNDYDLSGRQIRVRHDSLRRYYDLWHGDELKPDVSGNTAVLSFEMEARGFGAVLAVDHGSPGPQIQKLLVQMKELSQKPLASFSHEWEFLPQRMSEIPPTRASATTPSAMVKIPGAEFEFLVSGIEIEGGNEVGVDVQYPWENSPRRHHRHIMRIKSFYIDQFPVTNAEFAKFLEATAYHPKDDYNFLKDWSGGRFPQGWGNRPVTWISLEDARAYAAWAGKRLPHEWEWQYAAQGSDGRLYPWGSEWKAEAVPIPDRNRRMREPSDVTAHAEGASPFGVMDMVGNIWQWTDEFLDEHTRAAILRGGSYYQPQGSRWYFPQAYKLTEHGKYLLMAPSKDRSRAVGFRCVMDAE